MKLSIIGVKQSMQLKTNKKKNLKPIHQLYSFNFQREHQIIINSSYNTETQRHLQVFLLLFKKYSQAVDAASTESERNDLTAEIAAATLQHHSGAITEEGGERKRFLKRRCISSLDPKLSAWQTFCTCMQTETKLEKTPTNIHFLPLLRQLRELVILNSYHHIHPKCTGMRRTNTCAATVSQVCNHSAR